VKLHGRLARAGDKWVIDATPPVTMKLKRHFPRIKANRKGAVYLTATPETSRDLEWFFGRYPVEMSAKAERLLTEEASRHIENENAAQEIIEGKRLDRQFAWQAPQETHPDQLQSADLALLTGSLLVADEIAMGKSLTGLLTLRDGEKLPACVVCQTHLPSQWLKQLEKWTPLTGHIAKKTTPYKLAPHMPDGKSPDVLILPYSKLAGWAKALAGAIKVVIFDEVQELRRDGSQKHNAAGLIADNSLIRVGLTATPIYNYGEEVYNIFSILAPDALGSREEFIREWGAKYGSHVGVKEPNELASYLIEERLMIRHTWADRGIDKEKPIKVPHSIESDEHVVEELTRGVVEMAELLSSREASREELFRMSGEFDWKLRRATGLAKAPYVADFAKLLLEGGEQVTIFGWHHAVYDIWMDKLKDFDPVLYTGQESSKQKREAEEAFISGKARALLMSLRSGAGLDGLQEACHIGIFGELDWSPQMHDQCLGRFDRPGQTEKVVGYFLISENGTDPLMGEVLNVKRMQSEPFLNPDLEILEEATPMGDRIKLLAKDFLKQRSQSPAKSS
jgi:SNF2 family DNA or RNA helicase